VFRCRALSGLRALVSLRFSRAAPWAVLFLSLRDHDVKRNHIWSRVLVALLSATLSVVTGCSGQSRFLTGGPTVGQMKTSLSHLEYENVELKRSVAKLQRENRSMEDRLVQEQIDNGDLTARLDDARNLLRDRGIESDVRLGSRRPSGAGSGSSRQDDDPSGRTLPASRAERQRRKAPFAQISGQVDALPSVGDDDDDSFKRSLRDRRKTKSNRSNPGFNDDLDRQSYHPGPLRWNPVARADDDSTIQIR
jgi:hypothetical protein